MIQENCFSELNYDPIMIHKFDYFNHCKKTDNIMDPTDLEVYLIDRSVVLQEPLFKQIDLMFPIANGAIAYFRPFSYYRWHKDSNRRHARGVTINMLYTARETSLTLFGSDKVEDQMMNDILHLNYKKYKFYLFNTQETHCVINLEESRYLFSILFEQDKDSLTYNDVKEYLQSDTLL